MYRTNLFPFARIVAAMFVNTFALTASVSNPLAAQSAAAIKAATPDSSKALIGAWEGSYTSDHAGSGAMKLVVAKDSALTVTSLALAMQGEMQTVPVRNFAVTTTDISWIQDMMGMACEATAVLKNGQMKGAIVCGHGSVTFTLSKH